MCENQWLRVDGLAAEGDEIGATALFLNLYSK